MADKLEREKKLGTNHPKKKPSITTLISIHLHNLRKKTSRIDVNHRRAIFAGPFGRDPYTYDQQPYQ